MESELFKAIEEQCSIEALQKFISDKENVNLKNCSGETALHIVIRKWIAKIIYRDVAFIDIEPKIVQAVQLLIDAGADVNSKNKYGETALHLAAKDEHNRVDFIQLLLKRDGVDVDSQDCYGFTALQYAVQKPNKEVVECLIKAGADIKREASGGFSGYSLLHLAANALDIKPGFDALRKLMQKHTEVVEYLVGVGMDINNVTREGDTVLHLAAQVANVDLIKYLLNLGADINAKNKTGMTPLHSLVNPDRLYEDEHLFTDALEVLLSANADINAVEISKGNTPLHYFINIQYDEDIFNEDEDYFNEFSDSIDLKTTKSLFKILKIFLKYRADFKIKNLGNKTPMEIFLLNCYRYENFNYLMVLLNTLIKYGIMDVDSLFITRWLNHRTILHESCYLLNYNMIKFLVNYGANINSKDHFGETPLLKLIRRLIESDGTSDNCKILDYFLSLNPDINIITDEGSHILYINDYFISDYPEFLWKALMEYISKKKSIGYLLDEDIAQTIIYEDNDDEYHYEHQSYLDKCTEELKSLQELKFPWMNLYDILMDRKKKLDCYAKNKELVQEFSKLSLAQKYPIFGPSIVKRFSKALQKQEIMENSAVILSSCLPYHLDPSHLVIRKIISCIKVKYLRYLCEPESEELQLKIKAEIELNEFKISFDKYVHNCLTIN